MLSQIENSWKYMINQAENYFFFITKELKIIK